MNNLPLNFSKINNFYNLSDTDKSKKSYAFLICIIIIFLYLYVINYLSIENYGYELTDFNIITKSIIFGENKYDYLTNIPKILLYSIILYNILD